MRELRTLYKVALGKQFQSGLEIKSVRRNILKNCIRWMELRDNSPSDIVHSIDTFTRPNAMSATSYSCRNFDLTDLTLHVGNTLPKDLYQGEA